jgi:hypothetical protein
MERRRAVSECPIIKGWTKEERDKIASLESEIAKLKAENEQEKTMRHLETQACHAARDERDSLRSRLEAAEKVAREARLVPGDFERLHAALAAFDREGGKA